MRQGVLVRTSADRVRPLVLRGSLARTFGSLVSFLAVLFFFVGLYLLDDAFVHPLNAGAPGILAAASSITLAVILLYYLLKPRQGVRTRLTSPRRER